MIYLRKKSRKFISYLESLLEISVFESSIILLSYLETSYALQQAYALKACLARSLALGLKSPFESLIQEALNDCLAKCFYENEVYDNQRQAANAASFYYLDNYLVQRREQPLFLSNGA